ncbi:hypothetical protein [Nocardioides pantholopis]|uniref:hypothetical protein n=1 Tax=Nocardioides pantholopis TaxID=2483798 RepID=UPI000F085CA3|nr:hypothetical protein [Nocardioides pantholopis]
MARRVFLHIGLPKTGTSYLQTILWAHRDELREAGLLVPGRERRDHLWASLVVRADPKVARRHPRAPDSWSVLRSEATDWADDVVISHEFFCSASAEQARRAVRELEPAEVHVVVTAREPLGLFTSSWQESLKNRGTTPIEEYGRSESSDPLDVWDWRALDLALVLERWAPAVPADRVHVVVAPGPGDPPDELWRRFCAVLGTDPEVVGPVTGFPNASMGVAEAETLRRLNQHFTGPGADLPGSFERAYDRGVWIRTFLADERLVPRGGERFWPGADQQQDCRRRGDRAVELVRSAGFDVVGDLDRLAVPAELPPRRHPSSVTDAEVADVAVALAARLMVDLKDGARPGRTQGTSAAADAGGPGAASTWWRRLRAAARSRR